MVFFFTCVDERYTVYMGKDKYENEELLKYGWPEDVWFHVDSFSSAHVYLRMPTPEARSWQKHRATSWHARSAVISSASLFSPSLLVLPKALRR